MGLFTGMDASTSGLTAQRVRLDLIANNIANATTTRSGRTTAAGNPIPYQRQLPVVQSRDPHPTFATFISRETTLAGQTALAGQGAVQADGAKWITSAGGITSTDGLGAGVKVTRIIRDPKPFKLAYEPDSPDAAQYEELDIPVGYVRYPNVEVVEEMLDMISASRAYEANVTALNASKTMASRALDIGR